jgi:hypothetical protein
MANYEQQLVTQYGDQMAQLIASERAKGKAGLLRGSNVDAQDVGRIESAFKASDVFKAPNIQQTVNAPAQLNLGDLMGVRTRLEEELGYGTAQQDLLKAKEALSAFDIGSQEQQSSIGQRLVPMEVLRGEQALAGEQRAIGRQSLTAELQAKADLMSALGSQVDTRFGIYEQQRGELANLMTQAPGAGITFTDTLESAVSKLNTYQEKTKREQETADKKAREDELKRLEKERQDEYAQKLRAIAMESGVSLKTSKGGTRSVKDLESAIAKKNKEALDEAKAWEKEQMAMERAKFNKAMKDDTANGDPMKAELYDKLSRGEITRESAKAYYELATGKNWDIYSDPRTANNALPAYAGAGGDEGDLYDEWLKTQ